MANISRYSPSALSNAARRFTTWKGFAKFENGVLELTLPKKPGGSTHKIEIH